MEDYVKKLDSRNELIAIRTFEGTKLIHHALVEPNHTARFAMQLIERHAGITGQLDDNEDSSGRAKIRRDVPDEVVQFACDVAEKAFTEFEKRKWLWEIPTYKDLEKKAKSGN